MVDRLPTGAAVMDETFFTAQRRHRRTARLYTVLAAFGALLAGVPFAVILSPVVVGVAVIALDLLNLVIPTPDLADDAAELARALSADSTADGGRVEPGVTTADTTVHGVPALLVLLLLAVPTLAGTTLMWWLVRRFLLRDGLGGVLISAGGRPPDRRDAEEHQLVNVIEEMSIAAGIQPPRVLVLPAEVPNAAAFGRSPKNWTIAVSRGLLDDLDRDATQGVIAHLVASVGNGDLRMQHSLLSLFVARQLIQDTVTMPFARVCRQRVWLSIRMLFGRASPEEEARTIHRLLTEDDEDTDNFVLNLNFLTFKVAQFYTNIFVVGGFLALPFRVRRYLADATAVQLTRSADGLGRALTHLREHGRNLPGAGFAAIYTITAADGTPDDDTLQDALVLPASLHPPLHKRIDRLHSLGFRRELVLGTATPSGPRPRIGADWPRPMRWLLALVVYSLLAVIFVPLGVVFAGLVLTGIALSVSLGLLFWALVTAVVAVPLHVLLRGLA
jgi:Zn-dependent protease with chaperone function